MCLHSKYPTPAKPATGATPPPVTQPVPNPAADPTDTLLAAKIAAESQLFRHGTGGIPRRNRGGHTPLPSSNY